MRPFSLHGLLVDASPALRWATIAWAALLVGWTVLLPPLAGIDEAAQVDRLLDGVGNPWRVIVPPSDDALRPSLLNAQDQETAPLPPSPPLYHVVVSGVLSAVPDVVETPLPRLLAGLRGVSVLWLAPLPLFVGGVARILSGRRSLELAAGTAVLAVPQVAHWGAIVGPHAMVISLSALMTVLVARVYVGDRTTKTATWLAATTAAALLTSTVATALPLGVLAAYRAVHRRGGEPVTAPIKRVRWIVGPIWTLHLVALAGPWQLAAVSPITRADGPGGFATWLRTAALGLIQTTWGRFGWAEVGIGPWVASLLFGVVLAALLAAAWRRDPHLMAALVGPACVLALAAAWGSRATFARTGQLGALNGLVLMGSLSGALALAGGGMQRVLPQRVEAGLWKAVCALAVVLQMASWSLVAGHF